MVKKEWQKLAKNKILIIVMIALLLIPSIYTTLFLGSMWDPFAKLDRLPVAVVNEDKGTVFEGEAIHVGDELVDELKENASLKFDFVDKAEGERGLKKGSYYMMIDIPADFSKDAATVLDDDPVQMHLDYYTSPGKNYIASRLGEGAMEKIKGEVSSAVTKSYADTMIDLVDRLSDGMQDAADGAGDLKDGLGQIALGQQKIEDNMVKLSDGANTLEDGTRTLQDGADSLQKGTVAYVNGLSSARGGSDQLAAGTQRLAGGAGQLSEGASQYVSGVAAYTKGVSDYMAGVNQLSDGARQLSGLEQLGDVSAAITQISDSVNGDENEGSFCAGTKSLSDGLRQLSASVSAMKESASNDNIKALGAALSQAETIVIQSNQGIAQAEAGLSQIQTRLGDLTGQVDGMADSFAAAAAKQAREAIGQTTDNANQKIDQANAKIEKENAAIDQAITQIAASDLTEDQKSALTASLAKAKEEPVGRLEAGNAEIDLSAVSKACQTKLTEAAVQLDGAGNSLGTLTNSLKTASGYLDQISQGLSSAQVDENAIANLSAALAQASKGADDLNNGAIRLGGALDQLEEKTASFPDAGMGVGRLNAGFLLLTGNNEKLASGADALSDAGQTLLKGVDSASEGIGTLDAGMQTLHAGLDKLDQKGPVLITGMEKLYTGTVSLSDGAGRLADGSGDLADGTHRLGDGLDTARAGSIRLADGLSDGAGELGSIKLSDQTAQMFADPVDLNETEINEVKNNGHFMASYMMNVGLWVACIAFTLMYPLLDYEGELKSGRRWWLSKASVLYPLSILMALLMIFFLHLVLGFTPMDLGKTILVACVASISYMSMLYFFCVLFGKVGNFLMLIFTVVQLAGSAGTYPLEMSGHYANLVHKWLPFSYGVDAFRETISTGGSIWFDVSRLAGYALLFTLLTIAIFAIRSQKIRHGKPVLADRIKAAV